MTTATPPVVGTTDYLALYQNLAKASALWQQALVKLGIENANEKVDSLFDDRMSILPAFLNWGMALSRDPSSVVAASTQMQLDHLKLWGNTWMRMLGLASEPVAQPNTTDRRFRDDAWSDLPLADLFKQSYLINARWWRSLAQVTEGLSEHDAQKVEFVTRQFIDAMAPSNFAQANPEVWRATLESSGENLVRGMEQMLADIRDGQLQISMTDTDAFELGRNVAVTPGKVIFQNDLMQLIQYTPTTDEVRRQPLLIVPPWINKYYILDLQEKNSFIKWVVDQGHTVFLISWVNPDERHADKQFEDYLLEGPIAALDVIEQAIGEPEAHLVGYCLGGTLSASTLAYAAAKRDARIQSATLFTTLLDFSQPGELGIFLDEPQISALEKQMEEKGYLEGRSMAGTFNVLRSNDLIWSFYVQNYLLGKEPMPFDLLYWNADSTRMPAPMHSFYLRNMYLHNRLREPGGIVLGGEPIDLSRIEVPIYFVSAREDHIAPWRSTYAGTRLFGGPVRFVLSGSGHIAGIINPPSRDKYGHWVNETLADDPDGWLAGAEERAGSWWRDWDQWISALDGAWVAAREPGTGGLPAIEDAPGSYVRVRS